MDCSPPGPSVHGIFQARVLEWGAIAFSKLYFIVPIKSTTTMQGGGQRGRKQKEKKIQKNLQNKSQYKKCSSWVTAVRVFSLAGSHSPPHLPRMPSSTVLISGPAVGAAQNRIWSYFSVFLPPMSTALFSLAGALSDLFYIPQTQSLPSWSCGFNL